MAQVVKAIAPTSVTAAVSNGRSVAGARNVSNSRNSPIEELSASLGASLDAAGRYFDDFRESPADSPYERRGGRREEELYYRVPRVRLPVARVDTGSSQSFASVLEKEQPAKIIVRESPSVPSSFVRGPSYKAINQYEFNARVISGTENERGGSLNLTL